MTHLRDPSPSVITLDDLAHTRHAHGFVGAEHGDVPFSVILVHSEPGVGPKLHRHPYAEVFVVHSGQATFQVAGETMVIEGGHVVVSPPGEAHGFTNTGPGELLLTSIHGAGRFDTEWLADQIQSGRRNGRATASDLHSASDRSTVTSTMNDQIRRRLAKGHRIDITTMGRRTGQPRRIEIVFHNIDGRLIISGSPVSERKRAWLVNLEADPHMTFHLKGAIKADLPATARVITDDAERRATAEWIVANAWPAQDVDALAAYGPMIEVTIDDVAA